MLVQRRVAPAVHLSVSHLYTWVERGTVTVNCLAQKHNTMSLIRAYTRTNHEAASTLTKELHDHFIYYLQALNYTSVPVVAH